MENTFDTKFRIPVGRQAERKTGIKHTLNDPDRMNGYNGYNQDPTAGVSSLNGTTGMDNHGYNQDPTAEVSSLNGTTGMDNHGYNQDPTAGVSSLNGTIGMDNHGYNQDPTAGVSSLNGTIGMDNHGYNQDPTSGMSSLNGTIGMDNHEISDKSNDLKKRVAVIGAGISGLCTLKHLLMESGSFIPKVFERNSRIGGCWLYTDDEDVDQYGIPIYSCLYKSLRSNNPKPLMTLPGFPFNQDGNSYISHEEVLQYIEDFSTFFHLQNYIQFNTMVTDVSPKERDDGRVTWNIKYCSIAEQSHIITEEFDAVCICNGHYSKPFIPEVKGISDFKGKVLHSRCYRNPDPYEGKNVLILGASFSGQDISCDIAPVAKRILLSHLHGSLPTELHPKIEQRPGISHVLENSVVFEDGTEEEIDCFIFCTGFQYNFPFLSKEIINVKRKRVTPLYKHMLHIEYNNLLFIGIPSTLSYFPQIHEQSKAAVAILKGEIKLPTADEMRKDMENDYQNRLDEGLNELQAHFFGKGTLQWDYNASLAKLCGYEPLPTVLHKMACIVGRRRTNEFLIFRKQNFHMISSEDFVTS